MRENMRLFAAGGAGYSLLELVYRGRTHWTMALLGGACLVALGWLVRARADWPLWRLAAAGSVLVTAAELAVGVLVNIVLGWHVWDYSSQLFHLWGQICPRFSLDWFFLAYAVCGAMRFARRLSARRSARPRVFP